MSIHVEQATLAYTADELFVVVADVKATPSSYGRLSKTPTGLAHRGKPSRAR